jgi:HEAT repeat protein
VPSRRHVGLFVERRNGVSAEASFSVGRAAMGPRPVPLAVIAALGDAMHSAKPQVAIEALYAFGTLAPECAPPDRPELLRTSASDLVAMIASSQLGVRIAALRVVGRVYQRRAGDAPIDQTLGDAVIVALNDRNSDVRAAAMQALGAMRYDRATQALTDLFQYFKRGPLAQAALDALARIANPASMPVFVAQLSAGNASLKVAAIEGIARLGDKSKAADVEAAVSGERSDAVDLAGAFASASLSKGPIDSIVEALARPSQHDQAFGYLVELAPGRSRLLAKGAQDPDPLMRSDVADILGLVGDPAALPMLGMMKKDSDPQTARAAARAEARLNAGR